MNIGLVIYDSLAKESGGYRYDRELVSYLRSQGHSVEIIAISSRGYLRNMLHNFDPALLHRLADPALDVILQDELNHPSLFRLNRQLRHMTPAPILGIVHHLRSSERNGPLIGQLARWLERRFLRSLHGWIAVSQTTLADCRDVAQADRPSVIASGSGRRWSQPLNADAVRQRTRERGPLRMVFLANLIPRKRLHHLIEALCLLPRDSWRLTVIGGAHLDTAYSARIDAQIKRYDLADNVERTGWLEDAALFEALSQQHVLAVPSSYEGYGLVYMEGMGLGLPAIASSEGAAHEVITHGVNGCIVDPNDHQALAAFIREVHEDRERLQHLSLNALDTYMKTHTWADTGQRVLTFIESQVTP